MGETVTERLALRLLRRKLEQEPGGKLRRRLEIILKWTLKKVRTGADCCGLSFSEEELLCEPFGFCTLSSSLFGNRDSHDVN